MARTGDPLGGAISEEAADAEEPVGAGSILVYFVLLRAKLQRKQIDLGSWFWSKAERMLWKHFPSAGS